MRTQPVSRAQFAFLQAEGMTVIRKGSVHVFVGVVMSPLALVQYRRPEENNQLCLLYFIPMVSKCRTYDRYLR